MATRRRSIDTWKQLAQFTLSIVAINGWNRLNATFHTPAGNY
jgi:alkylhydroperoxidase family enzyme